MVGLGWPLEGASLFVFVNRGSANSAKSVKRDLETNGTPPLHPTKEIYSTLQWRRKQRQLWNLAETPSHYPTASSNAQPQREYWPVYDPDAGRYVEWSPETKHLESLLELSQAACLQLRCIKLFQMHA